MKKAIYFLAALGLFLSSCQAGKGAPAPTTLTTEVGNLSGTFQKPAGCNDPCQSVSAVFVTTDENLIALDPQCFINWGDGSPEEQLMGGTHTYPVGPSKKYDVALRCDVKNGTATLSVQLKEVVQIPFEVHVTTAPTEAPTDPSGDQ